MKAWWIYTAIIAALVAWLVSTKALSSWSMSLPLDERAPSTVEAMLIGVGLWSARAMPFVVVASVVAVPFLALAFAWLVREHPSARRVNVEPLAWFGVGILSLASAGLAIWRDWAPQLAMLFLWSGAVSLALSIALAYMVQKRMHAQGDTRIPPGAFLAGALVVAVGAPWATLFMILFPTWVEWRRRPTRA